MAIGRAGRITNVLSSVLLQILLYRSAAYSVFYFLSTLSMIIYKMLIPDPSHLCGYS